MFYRPGGITVQRCQISHRTHLHIVVGSVELKQLRMKNTFKEVLNKAFYAFRVSLKA